MKNFNSINILGFLGEKIAIGVLVYLSNNKELLEKTQFDCAYKIARVAYVKHNFGNVPLDFAKDLLEYRLECIVKETGPSDLEAYKRDTIYLAELIERYNIATSYIDVIEQYN